MATGLDDALTTFGAELVPVAGRRQQWAIQTDWRKAFAPDWHEWSGPMNDREWHVFSSGLAHHLEGAAAIEAFEAEVASLEPLIVTESLAGGTLFVARFAAAPTYRAIWNAWQDDLYIFCQRLRWTFVSTHENGLGPYFAYGANEGE
jgi:hypothetical protein